jgi:hypothetical protein
MKNVENKEEVILNGVKNPEKPPHFPSLLRRGLRGGGSFAPLRMIYSCFF